MPSEIESALAAAAKAFLKEKKPETKRARLRLAEVNVEISKVMLNLTERKITGIQSVPLLKPLRREKLQIESFLTNITAAQLLTKLDKI